MQAKFFRIRSWHIWDMNAVSRANRPYKSLCGKRPRATEGFTTAETSTLPLNEKSCERCLQIDETRA